MAGLPRQFMGKHPVFGETKRTKNSEGEAKQTMLGVPYKESPYYWWWYALRLSAAYREVCAKNGATANKSLGQVYADFGDVHGQTFREWWRQRGADLFAEPPAPVRVTAVKSTELDLYRDAIDTNQAILVAIPLWLTKRQISQSVNEVVAKAHGGKRGKTAVKYRTAKSQAKYKLLPYRDIVTLSLAIEACEKRQNGAKLTEIDPYHLPNAVRRVKDGKAIVAGVERGQFPKRK
jgi:hypothetical protein